jgi:hypothetical protein
MAALCLKHAHWEIIADNLHNTGWSLGWLSAVNREGPHGLDY